MKPTRYYSSKQEKQTSKLTGAKLQSNSGATAFRKGDLIDEYSLLECKTNTKPQQSVSIKKEWLTKLKEEMFAMNRRFHALVFGFEPTKADYVILPIEDYSELYDAWKKTME